MDAVAQPGVEDIVFIKATRVGGTTAGQIILGYWITNDPGNVLTVMPTEPAADEEIKDRVRPLLMLPCLASHVSPDPDKNTLGRIELDVMDIYTGWAGSPQSLGSRTCRYVRFDEVDKYPKFSGREADPINLGKERTGTYQHRKRHYITSTPTTRDGAIWKAWEACGDKRHFHVPCPHCRKYQRLVWAQVKWLKLDIPDKVKRADEIKRGRLAWYECVHCKGRIEESHKPEMLERGAWASEGQEVAADGTLIGQRPQSPRVGFHLSSLYSPWRQLWDMAAEFIQAEGDIGAAMNFRNSRLAEPFEVQVSKTDADTVRDKAKNGPVPKQVPTWARVLIATADTQKDHFYYTVRAWGFEYRSQLIDFGVVSTFEELKANALDSLFQRQDSGGFEPVTMLLIDSGGGRNADTGMSRTNEVYQFALSDPERIKPIKGASGQLQWPVDKSLQKAHGLVLWNIDTYHCKNLLNRLLNDPDHTKWMPHAAVNEDYCQQMASESLVIDPMTKRQEWKPKTSGAANHYWDCEVYQCAAAIDVGAGNKAPDEQPVQARQEPASAGNWATGGSRWSMKTW